MIHYVKLSHEISHLPLPQVIREIVNMLQGAPTSHVFECVDQEVTLRQDITLEHYSYQALLSALEYFKDKISMVSIIKIAV